MGGECRVGNGCGVVGRIRGWVSLRIATETAGKHWGFRRFCGWCFGTGGWGGVGVLFRIGRFPTLYVIFWYLLEATMLEEFCSAASFEKTPLYSPLIATAGS